MNERYSPRWKVSPVGLLWFGGGGDDDDDDDEAEAAAAADYGDALPVLPPADLADRR